ncbi:beta-defensin 107A-like [Erinaceus europaeus]|uniref:Beta-defensin n=1 Tax=Erinaceus europaeus TaxID=9365 RepID=A0A1S2ZCN6_ERIEU|nr:beta-defensin 107A-like [Erinaceus europaeus]
MRIFAFIFAAFILLAQIFSGRAGFYRSQYCQKMDGRCEIECLSFEVKIGGCRSDLTPLCCKRLSKY